MNEIVAGVVILAVVLGAAGVAGAAADRSVGDLRLSLAVGRTSYHPGETVTVQLRVTNAGGGPLSLSASSGQQYDLVSGFQNFFYKRFADHPGSTRDNNFSC